ncbi:MAG TPA: hypothetical protein VE988_07040 [Gemmataceae bacterium]|nr:hypothetical protein [Gemmataceae bacterium]
MFKRVLPLFVLVLVPALAWTDSATQPASKPPALILRISSLDNLFDQLDLIGSITDQKNIGKELNDHFKNKLGPKGLFAIDAKRPIAFYGAIPTDGMDLPGVLMLPVTGDKAFKEMLEALGWEVAAEKGGLNIVKQDFVTGDLQYRIAANYAYIGVVGQSKLDDLPKPEAIFNAKRQASVSATIKLDQIPEVLRGQMLDGFKEGFNSGLDKKTESNAQKAFANAVLKEFTGMLDSVFKEGEELNVNIDIDPKTKKLAAELTLTAKPRSKLADTIAKLGQRKTLFAGIMDKDAAMNGLLNFDMPASLRDAVSGMLQEAVDKALADLRDDVKKKQTTELFDALKPSLTAEDLDVGFSLRGPGKDKHFTLVAGFKLRQGDKLLATLMKLINDLPENERNNIKLFADKAGNVAIHRLDLQKTLDANVKEMFGEHPLFVAFRDDALFVSMGEDGLAVIKQAVTSQAKVAAPLQFDMSITRLASVLDKNPAAAKELQDAGDDGRIQLTLEGGQLLRARATLSLSAFKLFGQEK